MPDIFAKTMRPVSIRALLITEMSVRNEGNLGQNTDFFYDHSKLSALIIHYTHMKATNMGII